MLNAHPAEGETPSFKGSMMMVKAVDETEARKLLEGDIYVSSGVWDMENAQIIPVRRALSSCNLASLLTSYSSNLLFGSNWLSLCWLRVA